MSLFHDLLSPRASYLFSYKGGTYDTQLSNQVLRRDESNVRLHVPLNTRGLSISSKKDEKPRTYDPLKFAHGAAALFVSSRTMSRRYWSATTPPFRQREGHPVKDGQQKAAPEEPPKACRFFW